MLERVELGVLETNPRAKVLYEKFGFYRRGCKGWEFEGSWGIC